MSAIACSFDKEAVWNKVVNRQSVVLDMNAWINLADEKTSDCARVKAILEEGVSRGLIFCPLSFGIISELYKQEEDSCLRVGSLMEKLSLNVSYVNREEVFSWEVERCVRRLAGVGPIDLSLSGLYAPVIAYLGTRFELKYQGAIPAEKMKEFANLVAERSNSLTFTDLLKMRASRPGDGIFGYAKSFSVPDNSEKRKQIWDALKGDRKKILRNETESVYRLYIAPAINRLPANVKLDFWKYICTAAKDEYGGVLGEMLNYLPSIRNHIELMAAASQNPTRRDKSNDFFDFEVIPVPFAYASVFVAKDRGIRDLLKNRTTILKRSECHYCFELTDLERWLNELMA
jgi:hypothetical protein